MDALSGLVFILHQVEARLRWPERFLLVHVACLPKNLECERLFDACVVSALV